MTHALKRGIDVRPDSVRLSSTRPTWCDLADSAAAGGGSKQLDIEDIRKRVVICGGFQVAYEDVLVRIRGRVSLHSFVYPRPVGTELGRTIN